MKNAAKAYNVELQDRDLHIFRLIRDHRGLNNVQIQKAYWVKRNIRAVDARLNKLTEAGFLKKVIFHQLQPSNYYYLARRGFNELTIPEDRSMEERLYRPESLNVSGFFQKRVIVADIRIALENHLTFHFGDWSPDFEIMAAPEANFNPNDPKVVAAALPDGVIIAAGGETYFHHLIVRYHHFATKREQFTKRFRIFEKTWANYPKLIMAYDPERSSQLRQWYLEDLRKLYIIDINRGLVKWEDVEAKYSFAAYKTLMKTEKLEVKDLKKLLHKESKLCRVPNY